MTCGELRRGVRERAGTSLGVRLSARSQRVSQRLLRAQLARVAGRRCSHGTSSDQRSRRPLPASSTPRGCSRDRMPAPRRRRRAARPQVEIVVPVSQRGGRARAQHPPPAPLPVAPSSRSRWRIVIADNASTDGTPAIAARAGARAARRRATCGSSARAAAARCAPRGRRSDARVVCYMDVDLSTDLRGAAAARRAAAVRPQRPGDRHAARARRARRARAEARAHLARLQPPPAHRRCARASPTRSAASRPSARDALDGAARRRPRRRLVLRHRAARARPAARAADPRGAGRLGRRPRLARGHRAHRGRRPARASRGCWPPGRSRASWASASLSTLAYALLFLLLRGAARRGRRERRWRWR